MRDVLLDSLLSGNPFTRARAAKTAANEIQRLRRLLSFETESRNEWKGRFNDMVKARQTLCERIADLEEEVNGLDEDLFVAREYAEELEKENSLLWEENKRLRKEVPGWVETCAEVANTPRPEPQHPPQDKGGPPIAGVDYEQRAWGGGPPS